MLFCFEFGSAGVRLVMIVIFIGIDCEIGGVGRRELP